MKDSELYGENFILARVCVRNLNFIKNVVFKNLPTSLTHTHTHTMFPEVLYQAEIIHLKEDYVPNQVQL